MLNVLAKFLLVTSALSPPLAILGVNLIFRDAAFVLWLSLLLLSAALVASCFLILRFAVRHAEKTPLTILDVETRNYEALTFLFAYTLPFIRQDFTGSTANLATTATIFLLLMVVLLHSEAFHFNPLMQIVGYRFYAVKTKSGVSSLLITRAPLRVVPTQTTSVVIAPGVYVEIGGHHA